VTAADISEGMIGLAKQKDRTQQLGINYLVRDVTKTEAIGAIYCHLKPIGRLVAVTIDPKLSIHDQICSPAHRIVAPSYQGLGKAI
jgi:hypothetical protein